MSEALRRLNELCDRAMAQHRETTAEPIAFRMCRKHFSDIPCGKCATATPTNPPTP